MSEAEIMRQIQVAVNKSGTRIFRNNVAMGWAGIALKAEKSARGVLMSPGDVLVKHARPLHAGLCPGSSDLIGWTPVKITQEMVGKTLAVFTGLEVKDKTKATEEQEAFIAAVKSDGGIAAVVHSEKEAIFSIDGFKVPNQ